MLFFRIFQHLLPRAAAWKLTISKRLRDFFLGLSTFPQDIKDYVDLVWLDIFPPDTRELAEWERHFGIEAAATEQARRDNLDAEWKAQGGQDPAYIQGVLHAAGFTGLFIHESWSSRFPYDFRDPRLYTTQPLIGTFQCTGVAHRFETNADGTNVQPQCSDDDSQAQANAFLANDPGYIVNRDLTPRAPPPVPDDPAFFPFFIYFAGETFPNPGTWDITRRDQLERLLLKVCPTQHWIVLIGEGSFASDVSVAETQPAHTEDAQIGVIEEGFALATAGGEAAIATAGGDYIEVLGHVEPDVAWIDMSDPSAFVESGGALQSVTNKVNGEVWDQKINAPGYSATAENGLPGVVLTNDGIMHEDPDVVALFTDANPYTIVAVCRMTQVGVTDAFFGVGRSGGATGNRMWGRSGGKWHSDFTNDASGTGSAASAANDEQDSAHVHIWESSDGVTASHSLDGAANDPGAAALDPGTLTPTRAAVGSSAAPSPDHDLMTGTLQELRIYSFALTAPQKSALLAKLQTKWGL